MRLAMRRAAIWTAVGFALAAVFAAYLNPDLAVSVANQVWNCF